MSAFLELLQVSLGSRRELTSLPTSEEWMRLFDEAQRQAVIGVILDGLERLPEQQRPPTDVLLQWIGVTQMIEQQSKNNEKNVKILTEVFKEAGYDCCILKGIGISKLYPNPYRRQTGDIDLWVRGNRKEVMRWLQSKYNIHQPVWHNVGVDFFCDVPVEVHFHPSWSWNPFYNSRLQNFFEQEWERIDVGKDRKEYNIPSIEFQVIACLSHTYRHMIAEGVGLRHVVDYYYILKRMYEERQTLYHGQSNKHVIDGLVEKINTSGLHKFLAAMMWVLMHACGMPEKWMLCEPNEKEGRFLLEEVMAAGNFGHQRFGVVLPANSLRRYWVMGRHYPLEVLWMPIWKVWHWGWRKIHSY